MKFFSKISKKNPRNALLKYLTLLKYLYNLYIFLQVPKLIKFSLSSLRRNVTWFDFKVYQHWLGVKDFSNWPTIPQVYINGDFVGGCDILLEMHKNGELIEELKKAGIKSALLEKQESSQSDADKFKK